MPGISLNTLAQELRVDPVVNTSSTNNTRLFSNPEESRNSKTDSIFPQRS